MARLVGEKRLGGLGLVNVLRRPCCGPRQTDWLHEVGVSAALAAESIVIQHVNLAAVVNNASAASTLKWLPAEALKARGGTTQGPGHCEE